MQPPFDTVPIRVYVDLDPAFNQIWHAAQGIDRAFCVPGESYLAALDALQ